MKQGHTAKGVGEERRFRHIGLSIGESLLYVAFRAAQDGETIQKVQSLSAACKFITSTQDKRAV